MATASDLIDEMFSGHGFSPRLTVKEIMGATGLARKTISDQLYAKYKRGKLSRYKANRSWVYYKPTHNETRS